MLFLIVIVLVIIFIIAYVFKKLVIKEKFGFNGVKPKIYYINLDKAKERNERFLKRVKKATRIKGVTPDDISNLNVIIPKHCKDNTQLELSCSISHLKAMHTAYHQLNDDTNILIMEDDIIFLKNPDWKDLFDSAPQGWEILQLFTFETSVYEHPEDVKWVNFQKNMFSTGAYAMNKQSLKKILETFVPEYLNPNWKDIKTINFTKSKSVCAADFFIYQNMKTYVYTKILFNEEGFDSYIHPDHLDSHRQSIEKINKLIKSYEVN